MTAETPATAPLFELAPAELHVPLKVSHAGRSYRLRHLLRPPAPADWFAYEAALQLAVEELPADDEADEATFRLQVRSSDAALAFWERLAVRVEGYDLPSEGDWRERIPLAHKEAAVHALTLVAPAQPRPADGDAPPDCFPLLADEVTVVLEAVSSGVAYPRLVHRFRPPTVEAERAYRRLLSETLIVRGGRTPRTLLPPRLPGLVKLYDQLIATTEGYALHGQPLASNQQAAQQMDAWHKRVAVQALFGDLTTVSSAPEAAPLEVHA